MYANEEKRELERSTSRVTTQGFKLKYYPLSLIVIFLWLLYIGAMIATLEFAVKNVHHNGSIKFFNLHDWITPILLTIFAQGHTAITAMHLGRLALSALQDSATAPKTWAELFWLAGRSWQSPLGFCVMLWDRRILRTRISWTTIMFAFTTALALVLPIMVARAYPMVIIPVDGIVDSDTNQVMVITLDANATNHITTSVQMAMGRAGWSTGLEAEDLYNSRMYGNDTTGFFFSGDLRQRELGTLPGMWVTGGCRPMKDVPSELQQATLQKNGGVKWQTFTSWCASQGLDARPRSFNLTNDSAHVRWCTAFDSTKDPNWMNTANYNTTIIAWFDVANQPSGDSFINCTTSFSSGQAFLNSTSSTFEKFEHLALWNVSTALTIFYPPLYAMFLDLSQASDSQLKSTDDIWRGTKHMAAAVSLLASKSALMPQVHSVIGRIRDWNQVYGAAAILITWLFMLIFLTLRMFRRTFGSGLDSYTAARLVADAPHLMDGHCAGELAENRQLRTEFLRIGDSNPDDPVGHIEAGGSGVLDASRRYGLNAGAGLHKRPAPEV